MRIDSCLRSWRYINHLLTCLLSIYLVCNCLHECSCSWQTGSSSVGSRLHRRYLARVKLTALRRRKMERCSLRSHCRMIQQLDRHSTHQSWYSTLTAFHHHSFNFINHYHQVVLVVLWLGVGLVIEKSLVRLPARVLSSQLGQLSLPSLRGRASLYQ